MPAKSRLLVTGHFLSYAPGDRILDTAEMKRVLAEYPEYVLREQVAPESEPTKADVKAAGKPPEAEAREAVGLPAGPVKAETPAADAKPGKTSRVSLQG